MSLVPLQVLECIGKQLRALLKGTQAAIAPVAKNPPHLSLNVVIMIYLLSEILAADGAQAALLADHFFHLGFAHSVPLAQVVVTASPIEPTSCFATPSVMARLAVRSSAVAGIPVSAELI
jgi:hypothetical protein